MEQKGAAELRFIGNPKTPYIIGSQRCILIISNAFTIKIRY